MKKTMMDLNGYAASDGKMKENSDGQHTLYVTSFFY